MLYIDSTTYQPYKFLGELVSIGIC